MVIIDFTLRAQSLCEATASSELILSDSFSFLFEMEKKHEASYADIRYECSCYSSLEPYPEEKRNQRVDPTVREWKEANDFLQACKLGLLEKVRETYTPKLFEFDEYAPFRWACICGQLEVAKWLWEKHPTFDLQMWDNWILRRVCRQGHQPVVDWLGNIWREISSSQLTEYPPAFRRLFQRVSLLWRDLDVDENIRDAWNSLTDDEKREFYKITPNHECYYYTLRLDEKKNSKGETYWDPIEVRNPAHPTGPQPDQDLCFRLVGRAIDKVIGQSEERKQGLLGDGIKLTTDIVKKLKKKN